MLGHVIQFFVLAFCATAFPSLFLSNQHVIRHPAEICRQNQGLQNAFWLTTRAQQEIHKNVF